MKTFDEYWEHKGCRNCLDTYEECAEAAWNAALEMILEEIKNVHSCHSQQTLSNL